MPTAATDLHRPCMLRGSRDLARRHSTSTETLSGIRKVDSIVNIESDRRHSMIAEAAYSSERRGFASGHECDDWLAAEKQIDAAAGLGKTPTLAGPSSVPTSTDDVTQPQRMTDKHKLEQMPWYPTIERMPLLYNVETGPTLNQDNSVLLLNAEAEEEESAAGDRVVRETVSSTAAIAPIKVCADEVWAL